MDKEAGNSLQLTAVKLHHLGVTYNGVRESVKLLTVRYKVRFLALPPLYEEAQKDKNC